MPRMHILTPAEYAAFETPPVFTTLERQRFFDLPPRLEHLLGTFRTPTNQLCFVLTSVGITVTSKHSCELLPSSTSFAG